MTTRLFEALDDRQLRARPQNLNSIAWLIWHVARAEDIGVNRFSGDEWQVFDTGGWGKRIGTDRRELGSGMTSDEVTAFSEQADVNALRAYWNAVGQQTEAIVRERGAVTWEERVDPERVRKTVAEEGDYGPHISIDRVLMFYKDMTRGWAFAHFALTHSYGHFYEANVVRGALGFPGP